MTTMQLPKFLRPRPTLVFNSPSADGMARAVEKAERRRLAMHEFGDKAVAVQRALGPDFSCYNWDSGIHFIRSAMQKKDVDPLEAWRERVRMLRDILGGEHSLEVNDGSQYGGASFCAVWNLKGYYMDPWVLGLNSSLTPVSLRLEVTQYIGDADCEVRTEEATEVQTIRKQIVNEECRALATRIR